MYTLILTLYTFASGPAIALATVPGFTGVAACTTAGIAWADAQGRVSVSKYVCVKVS